MFLFFFPSYKFKASDAFIGYHEDTLAALVFQVCNKMGQTKGGEEWKTLVKIHILYSHVSDDFFKTVINIKVFPLLFDGDSLFDINCCFLGFRKSERVAVTVCVSRFCHATRQF